MRLSITSKLIPTRRAAGDRTLATALRTAIGDGYAGVELQPGGFEISGPDDRFLLYCGGNFDSPAALARFLGIDQSQITDSR
ncbi:hypothetical protein ABZ543_08215 [Streptomyces roseifaciens]